MLHNINLKQTKIKLALVLLFFSLLFLLVVLRLYLIQISQSDFFKFIAAQQYSTEIKVMPPRANIYDRNGKHVAINKEILSAFILPQQLEHPEKMVAFLKKQFKNTYKQIKDDPEKKFVWLQRNVSSSLKTKIDSYGLSDIHYLKEMGRFYPFSEISQVIGITDIDNLGISGVELEFNDQLSGTPSTLKIEKDARNNKLYFTNQLVKEGSDGKPINLTLDSDLQFLASEELKKAVEKFEAKAGCVLIINPTNGQVLSLVNYPYTDPNQGGVDQALSKNNITSECYEFGSVIKVFSAIAALDEKVTTTDEIIDCEGRSTYIDRVRIENWKYVEKLPFAKVVQHSSNVGIAKVAKRLGDKQYDHLIKLGFGKPTGIKFPGERSGFVAHPQNWSRSTPYVLSFGYEINATLIQLAQAFSIIANNGVLVKPSLLLSEKPETEKVYGEETMSQIKDILEATAHYCAVDGYRTMGKTGTARIAEKGGYSKKRHVYSYGGIIEKDNYKRVIVTFIKEPKATHLWASQVTAPLFKNIAEKMIVHDTLNHKT